MRIERDNPVRLTGRTGPAGRLPAGKALLLSAAAIVLSSAGTWLLATKYLAPERIWQWASSRGHQIFHDEGRRISTKLLEALSNRLFDDIEAPRIFIDIKFRDYQKLVRKRDEALRKRVLVQEADDFVPAEIRMGDRTIRVKLRLKGDETDHLEGDKWSFRVRVRGKEHLFGMRRFSIQHPWVRGFQGEALFFETLRYLDVLAPRYFFVTVTVNGKDIGVMAVEEHFSKEMLEANERKESVIVRFDESLVWQYNDSRTNAGLGGIYDNFHTSPIDAFGSSRIAGVPKLALDNSVATGLLRGFSSGALAPSTVFDAELMGRFAAAADAWGSWHSFSWRNMRFYFNPLSAKLEPIGFDASIQFRSAPGQRRGTDMPIVALMRERILADDDIFPIYKRTLRELREQVAGRGELVDRLRTVEAAGLPLLRTEFFLLDGFELDELIERTDILLGLDDASLLTQTYAAEKYPALIQGWQIEQDGVHFLELSNSMPFELTIDSIFWAGQDGTRLGDVEILSKRVTTLAATPKFGAPDIVRLRYRPRNGTAGHGASIHVAARISGEPETYLAAAMPYHATLDEPPLPRSSVAAQLAAHGFLRYDAAVRALRIPAGHWQVDETIIVPPGHSLLVDPGTTLTFAPDTGLIAHGPVQSRGSAERPIVLRGRAAPGEPGRWEGVAVLNAPESSHWSHTRVLDTTGFRRGGWQPTGAVLFYRSEVKLDHCSFSGNLAEDALNIVHSRFEISGIEIDDTASDAFDADFSDGIVIDGSFSNIGTLGGGDAIDISGSTVTVSGTRFEKISDKALSVGERSRMTAARITVLDSGSGAVAKDGSALDISDSEIRNPANAGLMAYIKKPEYGAARIIAAGVRITGAPDDARAQTGSEIVVDGQAVATEAFDVEELYDTIMKPGLK